MSSNMTPFDRVHSLIRQRRFSKALELLLDEESNSLNHKFHVDKNHAWYCVGDIFFRQGKYEEAKYAFKKAISFRPNDEDALEAIGNCYDEQKRPKLAERYFRRALNITTHLLKPSDRAAITFNLANALFDQNKLDEAINLYKQLTRAHISIRKSARRNLELAISRKSQRRT